MKILNIGYDFSFNPTGPFDGEVVREKLLMPLLRSLDEFEELMIILDDDVEGYGASFLSECFGGIVKYGYMRSNELLLKLNIVYTNKDFEFFEKKILEYIKNERFNSRVYEKKSWHDTPSDTKASMQKLLKEAGVESKAPSRNIPTMILELKSLLDELSENHEGLRAVNTKLLKSLARVHNLKIDL